MMLHQKTRIAGLVALLLLLLGATSVRVFAAAGSSATAGPAVIQGTVAAVDGNVVSLKTQDIAPHYPPGTMHPTHIVAGRTYRIDISKALFQAPDSSPMDEMPCKW